MQPMMFDFKQAYVYFGRRSQAAPNAGLTEQKTHSKVLNKPTTQDPT